MAKQKITEKLVTLVEKNGDIKKSLEGSLLTANEPGLRTLDEFYSYIDRIVTHIPTENELMPSVRQFYFVLDQSPGSILRTNQAFNDWITEFVNERGNFMDSTDSTATLESFINNPEYKIDDYIKGPSGWMTYNQFLARQLKPGKRPIDSASDNAVITCPADSEFRGTWMIEEDATITVKGVSYSIGDLLGDSAYKDKFTGGTFTHSFLAVTDYHRYHMPVAGIIREVKKTPGSTWVNEKRKPDGSLENIDDVGFQFTHTRAHIIVESAAGYVAVMPVGMGHISSVVITAEEGMRLTKGEEFGFFAFGGSDIIMLFQRNRVQVMAKKETKYKMGEAIANVIGE
jgi:phosphatidylserine decarboxylase